MRGLAQNQASLRSYLVADLKSLSEVGGVRFPEKQSAHRSTASFDEASATTFADSGGLDVVLGVMQKLAPLCTEVNQGDLAAGVRPLKTTLERFRPLVEAYSAEFAKIENDKLLSINRFAETHRDALRLSRDRFTKALSVWVDEQNLLSLARMADGTGDSVRARFLRRLATDDASLKLYLMREATEAAEFAGVLRYRPLYDPAAKQTDLR